MLDNCEVHFYSLYAVHIYDLYYHTHIISFSSYNRLELNLHLTCFQRGFIAQLLEHRTGIAEVMATNPVEASDFFLGFLCNCLSYFTTVSITFTSILLFFILLRRNKLLVFVSTDTCHNNSQTISNFRC